MNEKVRLYLQCTMRALVPPFVTLVIVLLSQLPYGAPYLPEVTPALSLIAVYYWSIYRPELLPAYAVFLIGLVQDILSGTPLGITALVLLVVHAIVSAQRRVFLGKTFLVEWWGFLLVAGGALAATWLIASLFFVALLPPGPVVVQLLLTVALYPPFMWVLSRIQRVLVRTA